MATVNVNSDWVIDGLLTTENVALSASNPFITGNDSNGITSIISDSSILVGTGLRLYGSVHPGQANDIELESDGATVYQWDDSINRHIFINTIQSSSGFTVGTTGVWFAQYLNDAYIYATSGEDIILGGGIGGFQNDVIVGNGYLQISSVSNEGTTATKILTLDSGNRVDFRTPAEILSDIGASSQTLSLGADNQIPFMNGTTDFEYNAQFNVNTSTGILTIPSAGVNDEAKIASNGNTFMNWNDGSTTLEFPEFTSALGGFIASTLNITTVTNATTDVDKFLVYDGTLVRYRTGAQVLSDIVTLGTDNQVPFMNAAGDDFEYDAAFKYDNSIGQNLKLGTTYVASYGTAGASYASPGGSFVLSTSRVGGSPLSGNLDIGFTSSGAPYYHVIRFAGPGGTNQHVLTAPQTSGTIALLDTGAVDSRYLLDTTDIFTGTLNIVGVLQMESGDRIVLDGGSDGFDWIQADTNNTYGYGNESVIFGSVDSFAFINGEDSSPAPVYTGPIYLEATSTTTDFDRFMVMNNTNGLLQYVSGTTLRSHIGAQAAGNYLLDTTDTFTGTLTVNSTLKVGNQTTTGTVLAEQYVAGTTSLFDSTAQFQGRLGTNWSFPAFMLWENATASKLFGVSSGGGTEAAWFPIFNGKNDNTGVSSLYFLAQSPTGQTFPVMTFESRINNASSTSDSIELFRWTSGYNNLRMKLTGAGNLTVTGDLNADRIYSASKLNIGIALGTDPDLHVYRNTAVTASQPARIEQDGTGDVGLEFKLTGATTWSIGIDNSDSDNFKISRTSDLASGNAVKIDSSYNVTIAGNCIYTQTLVNKTASYSIVTADTGKVLTTSGSANINFTVNTTSLTDNGDIVEIDHAGTGTCTVVAGTSVTLNKNSNDTLVLDGQYSRVMIQKMATNTYRVFGQLTPA